MSVLQVQLFTFYLYFKYNFFGVLLLLLELLVLLLKYIHFVLLPALVVRRVSNGADFTVETAIHRKTKINKNSGIA